MKKLDEIRNKLFIEKKNMFWNKKLEKLNIYFIRKQ